jgi:hypothetical protein
LPNKGAKRSWNWTSRSAAARTSSSVLEGVSIWLYDARTNRSVSQLRALKIAMEA